MRKLVILAIGLFMVCGQLIRLPVFLVPYKNTAILPNDLGLFVIVVLVLLWKLYRRRLFYREALLAWPIAAFLIAAAVSLGVNTVYYNLHNYEVFISGLYLGRWALYCAVYFVFLDIVETRRHIIWAVAVFGAALLLFASFGIYQAITLPNFAYIVHPEDAVGAWDLQKNRLVSTFLDPNLAGCLIAVGLIFAVLWLMEGYKIALLPIAVFAAALVLTYSRGSLLSFGVAVLYLVLTGKHKWRGIAGLVVACGVFALLIPYLLPHAEDYNRLTLSDYSAMWRIVSWRLCLTLIRDNFFFGVGFDTLPYVVGRYGFMAGERGSAFGLEGGLLTIFALSGVFGLAAYCYLFGKVLWTAHLIYAKSGDKLFRVIAKGTFASVLVIVTSSLFTLTLLFIFIMEFYWGMFALLNVVDVLSRRSRPETAERERELFQPVSNAAHFARRPVPTTWAAR
jgi:hypothetical protein